MYSLTVSSIDGVAEHVAQEVVDAGDGAGQRDLGAAEKDDVRQPAAVLELRAQQAGRQRMPELDELGAHLGGEPGHGAEHGRRRPEHRRGGAHHRVAVRGVEGRRVDVRRREDGDLGRIERADGAPVVRLSAADARREVVGDEERARRPLG